MTDIEIERKDVLDCADALFSANGFEGTTLLDIANETGIHVEMIEQEYCCKEHIALQIYNRLAEQSLASARALGAGTLSEMYYIVLEQRLSLLSDHIEISSLLFANAMRPQATITMADIAPGMRDPMMQAMQFIMETATNKPRRDQEDLTFFLYAFHFLVIIFWLYDRTDGKAASHMFTKFLRDFVKMMRPMLVLPLVAKALTKASRILMVVFGGARIVDPAHDTTS